MGALIAFLTPIVFVSGIIIIFFVLAFIEFIWKMDKSELKRRYNKRNNLGP